MCEYRKEEIERKGNYTLQPERYIRKINIFQFTISVLNILDQIVIHKYNVYVVKLAGHVIM